MWLHSFPNRAQTCLHLYVPDHEEHSIALLLSKSTQYINVTLLPQQQHKVMRKTEEKHFHSHLLNSPIHQTDIS